MFFYLLDLFKGSLMILVGCDGFHCSSIISFIEVEITFNLKSMHIAIISKNSQDDVIQLIKIFCFEFHKIYLNRLSDIIVLDIYYLVLFDLVYNILIKQIVVCYLNVKASNKKNIWLWSFELYKRALKVLRRRDIINH